MGHGVTVNLDDCPENKTRRNFTHRFKLVSLVCVLALLNSREEQIALLRGLSDNDCLFACAFFLAALSNSSPTKHARPRRMITHRCSLRTRRTGHPGLTGATLHKWEQKKNKLMFLFFFTSDWSYSSLSLLAHTYLDSRNARCAIFPINTRQTLKKQADESVDFIWHTLPSTSTTVAWKNKSAFTHILSLFANCTLWALDTSAALQKIKKSASVEPRRTSVSLPPFKLWNSFFFFFTHTTALTKKKKKNFQGNHYKSHPLCLLYRLALQVVHEVLLHPEKKRADSQLP